MTPTFKGKFQPIYEPPYVPPATHSGNRRRAYLKHRSWVLPVLVTLGILFIVCGALMALAGWEAPQL
jgi:hypothetical protein